MFGWTIFDGGPKGKWGKSCGLMSGTLADGVDAAVVEIRGAPPELSVDLLAFTLPFDDGQRARVFVLFDPSTGTVDRICQMNFAIGEWFAAAAVELGEGFA